MSLKYSRKIKVYRFFIIFKYPGWTLTLAGSLFMAAVNDDASGVYTCTPYNSYGTMGSSGPTNVILKVSAHIIRKFLPGDVGNVTLYVSTPAVRVF